MLFLQVPPAHLPGWPQGGWELLGKVSFILAPALYFSFHLCLQWQSPPPTPAQRASEPHTPEMACTATRRKPFTSPFSLTMATRCTRGTGYSRLLRYTKALQEQSHCHRRPSGGALSYNSDTKAGSHTT